MKVSIVMPYYNAAKYIQETVDSILDQTYENWELLIVDDCSTASDTEAVLQSVSVRDPRIRVLRTPQNGGAGVARNVGVEAACGRYISFCDADDWWYPTKLEEQLKFMEDNGYEFTCTYYEDAKEDLTPYYTVRQPLKMSHRDLVAGCSVGTPGVMIDTKRIGKVYMPNLRRAEDWGTWLKVLERVDFLYVYPKPLWKYRHIEGSISSNKLKQAKSVMAMYNEVLGYSSLWAFLVFLFVFFPKNVLGKLRKL